jgi:hypothetical protein
LLTATIAVAGSPFTKQENRAKLRLGGDEIQQRILEEIARGGEFSINNAIEQAADRGTLRIFIIDPLGVDVLDENRPDTSVTRVGGKSLPLVARSVKWQVNRPSIPSAKCIFP